MKKQYILMECTVQKNLLFQTLQYLILQQRTTDKQAAEKISRMYVRLINSVFFHSIHRKYCCFYTIASILYIFFFIFLSKLDN